MLMLLSFRKNFDSRVWFGEQPILKTGVCLSNQYFGEAAVRQLIAETKDRRVLFLIHGYSNDADAAIGAYRQIQDNLMLYGLDTAYDVVVGILWPGHTSLGFWAAEPSADKTAHKLREILRTLQCEAIDIEGHSLGNRVLLESLTGVNAPLVRNAILWAPALNDRAIQRGERYHMATQFCHRVLVGYSSGDEVLGFWFRRFSMPLVFNDLALGYHGPDDINECAPSVVLEDGSKYIQSHGDWKNSGRAYAAWLDILKGK